MTDTDVDLYNLYLPHEDTLRHLNRLFYTDLHQCGCGNPADTWELIHEVLSLAPFFEDQRWKQVEDILGRAYDFVLGVLSDADLLEHGGSVGGSWITDKGRWLLQAIERVGLDDLDEKVGLFGLPHFESDDGECGVDCWKPAIPTTP
jgi:hypothetical protein